MKKFLTAIAAVYISAVPARSHAIDLWDIFSAGAGAVVGYAACSPFSDFAQGVCTALGGFLGHEVGDQFRSNDPRGYGVYTDSYNSCMAYGTCGQWSSPGGYSGHFRPGVEFESGGTFCRSMNIVVYRNNMPVDSGVRYSCLHNNVWMPVPQSHYRHFHGVRGGRWNHARRGRHGDYQRHHRHDRDHHHGGGINVPDNLRRDWRGDGGRRGDRDRRGGGRF